MRGTIIERANFRRIGLRTEIGAEVSRNVWTVYVRGREWSATRLWRLRAKRPIYLAKLSVRWQKHVVNVFNKSVFPKSRGRRNYIVDAFPHTYANITAKFVQIRKWWGNRKGGATSRPIYVPNLEPSTHIYTRARALSRVVSEGCAKRRPYLLRRLGVVARATRSPVRFYSLAFLSRP